jgi:hypothetical protein
MQNTNSINDVEQLVTETGVDSVEINDLREIRPAVISQGCRMRV